MTAKVIIVIPLQQDVDSLFMGDALVSKHYNMLHNKLVLMPVS